MSSFQNRLKAMNKTWKDSEGESAFQSTQPGTYRMQIQGLELKESISSGKLMIAREFLILDGEFQGEVVHDNMMLETEKGPMFIRMFIEQMGYENPENSEELPDTIASIANEAAIFKGRVTESEGYNNVRILKIEEIPEGGTQATTEESAKEAGEETVTEETNPEEEKLFDDACAFCQAAEIDLDEENGEDLDSIKEKISANAYLRTDLTLEEIKLLEDLGIADECISEPEPKPEKKTVVKKKVAKKIPPKKTVKKTVKKTAKRKK